MSFFGWVKKLWGEGTIHFEGVDTAGGPFSGRVPYTGDLDTLDEEELYQCVNACMGEQHGRVIDRRTFRITRIERK